MAGAKNIMKDIISILMFLCLGICSVGLEQST
jgi:hypothetical protein